MSSSFRTDVTNYYDHDLTVVTLSKELGSSAWMEMDQVERVINLAWASPSGRRFGRLSLGLGIDSLAIAVKARVFQNSGAYLVTNPWIAFFLSYLTRRPLFVTGIYASPGSRSWTWLMRALKEAMIITTAHIEAENWSRAGGHAVSVLYGNNFPYDMDIEPTDSTDRVRIFVGGTSDRDMQRVAQLEQEVLESELNVSLDVAVGGQELNLARGGARVHHLRQLSQEEFGRRMASADVVYLPLRKDSCRAAGHMITVGALQVGTPVVYTRNIGMAEYDDGRFVRRFLPSDSQLEGLLNMLNSAPGRDETRAYWQQNFSRQAYVRHVGEVIRQSRHNSDIEDGMQL
ncbi:hypothetical protein GCM10009785_28130 [Brooklawnia cerclae]|uniref:Glycosyltransferase n=1 Tax=Brooklawnia cerclae TaxID=349934 RepID=A0ABX0SET7_9ACTN|nr:glycosyltransferase family 4 protein [Brooklawnia cerclae]NIH56897.1 hypothetical protein [Brooklawnia cerclae]